MKIFLKLACAITIVVAGYIYGHTEEIGQHLTDTLGNSPEKLNSEEYTATQESEKANGTEYETNESSYTTKLKADEKNNTRRLELPGKLNKTPERIIEHSAYTLSFNREHNQPNWVAWELTARETEGHIQRTNDFQPDPLIPSPHQVTTEDYKNSGYDRGHMAPAADMKWSGRAMTECFYMSNMCPQHGSLNSGAWSTLEKACRRWAKQEGSIYIVCGPVFTNKKHKKIGKDHKITVPDKFFKVILSMKKNHEKAIGFLYNNKGGKQAMQETAKSVDEIEEITGIDFFVNLPDKIENKLESEYSLKKWQ